MPTLLNQSVEKNVKNSTKANIVRYYTSASVGNVMKDEVKGQEEEEEEDEEEKEEEFAHTRSFTLQQQYLLIYCPTDNNL